MNTFVFYIALIICYLPMYVSLTLFALFVKDWQTEWEFVYTVVIMNSSINPLLYCWRLRELRTAVVKTARQMLCKQTEENQTEFFLNETQYKRVTARKQFSFLSRGYACFCSPYSYRELQINEASTTFAGPCDV